jgi:LacI family transcriptional regulator
MAKTWTMNDIAQAAGVSQTTVSMVLNDDTRARIAKTTRERVLKVAKELGYTKSARLNLGRQDTRVIGMLIDEVGTTPMYAPLLQGADEEARADNCVIATYRTHGDPDTEAAAIAALQENQLAGVLYATLTKRQATLPEALHAVPTVMLNCYSGSRDDLCVVSADRPAAYVATEALLKAGHRRIGHLAAEAWVVAGREREDGYCQALLNWDIPIDRSLVLQGAWTFRDGRELASRLLDRAQPPTALFCFNDRMAVGAYEAIKAHGLRIPEDISVIGFDNELDFVTRAEPPLTTMLLPHEQMAREAVRMLLDIAYVRSASQHPRMLKIECPMVLRESVGPPPKG